MFLERLLLVSVVASCVYTKNDNSEEYEESAELGPIIYSGALPTPEDSGPKTLAEITCSDGEFKGYIEGKRQQFCIQSKSIFI